MESFLSHVQIVSIREMIDKNMITEAEFLATAYLLYGSSLANTRYIRIVKDAKAVAINIVNESLNITFIGLIL